MHGGHHVVHRLECFSPQVKQTTDIIDVTVASVEEAVRTLYDVAITHRCDQLPLDALSEARVFLKCEKLSARRRDAYWRQCGVVAALLTSGRELDYAAIRVASEPRA
jgi:hypothetical protein